MKPVLRSVAVVPPDEPAPATCERCKDLAKEKKELKARIRDLEQQVAKLTRAVQRESHHMEDKRITDGGRLVERRK